MAADFTLKAILEFVNKSGPGVKDAEQGFNALGKAAVGLGAGLTAAGVVAAGKAAYELAQLGAQSLRTEQGFKAISGGAANAAANLEAMRSATQGAMSEQAMMASASRLMQMGLATNSTELEKMTTMAVRLGRAMGVDATTAINDFSLMLANQSVQRLDTFGISSGKVRARIEELMKSSQDMTREAAFMQATMEIGAEAMGRLGEDTGDAALAFEQLTARIADLKAGLGEELAPNVSETTRFLNNLIAASTGTTDAQKNLSQAINWLLPGWSEYADGLREINERMEEATRQTDGSTAAFRKADAALGLIQNSAPQAAESIKDLHITMHLATDRAEQSSAAFRNADAALSGLVRPADAASEAYERLTGNVGNLAGALSSFDVSAEASWGMLTQLADQGLLTADQVKYLAEQQGIATSEQIEATMTQHGLIDAYATGAITITSLNAGLKALATYEAEATAAAEAAAEGNDEAAAAHKRNAEQALGLAGAMLTTKDAAIQEKDAIEDIPPEWHTELILEGAEEFKRKAGEAKSFLDGLRDKTVNVRFAYHSAGVDTTTMPGYQHGTAFARGGLALVGEAGPELVMLPRGAAVVPSSRSFNYTRGGDTFNVSDGAAVAAIRESRYRADMQRMSGRM